MPRLPYDPDEEAPAALSWALARRVPRLRGSATDAMIIETSLGVFCGLLPAWSVEVGAPFVVTETRMSGGWVFTVGPAASADRISVRLRGAWWDPAAQKGRRQTRTALQLIAHGTGDTPRWADAWADAWRVAVWLCAYPGCERRFRHYAQAARHERRAHGPSRDWAKEVLS
ncbi:MAG: hypothetical protein ACP5QO_17200 [Clostridia bacterium]